MPKVHEPTRDELLRQVLALERQLLSQEDIQGLIQELHIHQEEVRVQNAALFETQRELESSRDRYVELYDFAPIALGSLDANGVIVSMNLTAARMLSVERARLIGMPLVIYVLEHDRRRFLDYLARCRRETGPPAPIEIELLGGASEPVAVELGCKRFQSGTAFEPVFYIALADLRERRRADADRLRATFDKERLASEEAATRLASEAKDRFLAVLSHELRTPLTPILLMLDRLDQEVADAATVRHALDTIRRNLVVETRLIDDLLDVTRIARDRLTLADDVVDLHVAIRHAVEMCAEDLERAGIGVEVDLGAKGIHVRGDGTRLRQVFWNLLTNAVRYTAAGGSVRVQTYERDGVVCADVTDTGRGMEAQDLERAFQPFEQLAGRDARSAGLGLGLAICRGLVEAHQGTIRAASIGRGQGTTFTVELPTTAEPLAGPPRRGIRPIEHAGLRILLVEDNADTADAMATLLRMHGYRVDVAGTLADARRAADSGDFDVLLSDLQLPDGNALELVRDLTAQRRVSAIAMSGYGTDVDMRRSREAGFAKHLVKPVAIEHVLQAIEEVAAAAAGERELQ